MDCSPPSTSVHGILPGKSTGVGFPSGKVLTFCDSLSSYVKWCVCVCVCVVCVVCVCVSSILPSIRPIQSRHSSFLFAPTPPNLEAGHKDMVKRTLHFWAPLTFAFLLPFLPVFFFFDLHSICTQRASLSHNAYTFCSTVQPTFKTSNKTSFEISVDNIFLLPPKLLKKHEFITGFESLNPLEMNVLN